MLNMLPLWSIYLNLAHLQYCLTRQKYFKIFLFKCLAQYLIFTVNQNFPIHFILGSLKSAGSTATFSQARIGAKPHVPVVDTLTMTTSHLVG